MQDELDKAIAEHQELSEENKYEEVVENNPYILQKDEEQNYIEEIARNRFAVQDFDEKPKRKGRHF